MDSLDVYRLHRRLAFHVVDAICSNPEGITGNDVADILCLPSVKGIGPRLNVLRSALGQAGIAQEEAIRKARRKGRTLWLPGPRIRQARYVLYLAAKTHDPGDLADPRLLEAPADDEQPAVVFRVLLHQYYYGDFEEGMEDMRYFIDEDEEFDDLLDREAKHVGEIFIHDIRTAEGGSPPKIPPEYRENGIFSRGLNDYARPRTISNFGTAWNPSVQGAVARARWVERSVRLSADPRDHYDALRIEQDNHYYSKPKGPWRFVDEAVDYRYVSWFGVRGAHGHRSAPPLDLRLRCWRTVTLRAEDGREHKVDVEGLRDDDDRTARHALSLWRAAKPGRQDMRLQAVRVDVAKRQPRPLSPIRSAGTK